VHGIFPHFPVIVYFLHLNFQSLLVTWYTNSLTFNNCTLCLHCIYVFCIYLRTNSDLCHLQHKMIGFYNRDEKCLQRGTDWVFKLSSLRFVFKGLMWLISIRISWINKKRWRDTPCFLFQQHSGAVFRARSNFHLHPPTTPPQPGYRVPHRVLPLYKCLESISEISSKEAERNRE
jgi:hypothetical protein